MDNMSAKFEFEFDRKGLEESFDKEMDQRLRLCALKVLKEAQESLKQGGGKVIKPKYRKGQKVNRKKQYRKTEKIGGQKIKTTFQTVKALKAAGYYYNKMRGGYVQASKPGTPPNRQTGHLRSSLAIQRTAWGTYRVGPTTIAAYSIVHEFGGRHHPKRPFMGPALIRARASFPGLFRGIKLQAPRMLRAPG